MDILIADVIGDVALVLVVSWLFGAAARRCGQPTRCQPDTCRHIARPELAGTTTGHLTNRLFRTQPCRP